ncbi:tetratricopeptide repeat protein [Thiolapillus sp.]
MPAAGLQIFPESAVQHWLQHPWHQEIADFKLPEKELLALPSALLTASRHLGPEQAEGGVYAVNGRYVSSSRHLRRNKDLTATNPRILASPDAVPKLPGTYLYLGWFFNHYGHFILESLARAWAVQEVPGVDGYIMHVHAAAGEPAAHLFAFFELLGIPQDKLIFVEQDMRVEELLLPSQQAVLSRCISAEMLELYRQLGSRAALRRQDIQGNEKLYVSRRFLAADLRTASNEKALEDAFRADGYRLIHPQYMDVTTQLALFNAATQFAGLEGSGLHNVLFSEAPQSVWMLGAENHLADAITQVNLDQQCGCATELHLQTVAAFPCLHPRVTPFVIASKTGASKYLENTKVTPYDRFLWLTDLAAQFKRKRCAGSDTVCSNKDLAAIERRVLEELLGTTADETYAATSANDHDLLAFLRAKQAFDSGNMALAVELMTKHLPAYGQHAGFLFRLAQMLMANEQQDLALDTAGRALELDSSNPELRLLHAQLLLKKKEVDVAIAQLEHLTQTWPRYFPATILLAEALAAANRFDEAADALAALLTVSARHDWLLARFTWYLFRAGKYEAAKEVAHQALKKLPDNPYSHVHLARIHLALDEPKKALKWIDLAIERSPGKKEWQQLQQSIRNLLDE